MDNAYAIIGMQYGSEAKGALAGFLAYENRPDTLIANWSPNAGHTFRNGEYKLVRRCIPIGTVSNSVKRVLLGPGSIIDPRILADELQTMDEAIEVIIHPNAAVVHERHEISEQHYHADGRSTKKGAGEAAIERMRRQENANVAGLDAAWGSEGSPAVIISSDAYHDAIASASIVQIEGCQGYSLSMFNGFYPYTTSRDTTIHQLKADIAWHGHNDVDCYGAVRTYPIRIAEDSGPCYPDQAELSWDNWPGLTPEVTTVTQKQRRIFSFFKAATYRISSDK